MLEAMESVKRALSIDFKVEIARAARLRPDASRLGARTDNRPRFTTAVTVCRPGLAAQTSADRASHQNLVGAPMKERVVA